jgi:hypothetical protein
MTLTINAGSGIHTGPPDSYPIPPEYLHVLQRALHILLTNLRNNTSCNGNFSSLPGGRDFRSLIDDHTIWINYDPTDDSGGWTMPDTHPRDIVINRLSLRWGRWFTAKIICHELAHLDGAAGAEGGYAGRRSTVVKHAAEFSVKACHMISAGLYEPTYVEDT